MRCCIIRTTLVGLLIVVSFVSGFSQSAPTAPRPKVGLVLEGGGALGLAHIGVIQWLEEHRIPVNYVAGTSMGGLVGGIYATGHSAAEVKELVKTINWDQVLQGQTPYKDLSFRRKQANGIGRSLKSLTSEYGTATRSRIITTSWPELNPSGNCSPFLRPN